MRYAFVEFREHENTALNKAPEDVLCVANAAGFSEFPVNACAPMGKNVICKIAARLLWCLEEWRIAQRLRRGDVVLLQCPPGFLCRRAGRSFLQLLHCRGIRFIYLIHDIGELRESNLSLAAQCKDTLRFMFGICDVLVAHNARMKEWLGQQGYPRERIVELGIFDYLSDSQTPFAKAGGNADVIIAGNLSAEKSAYLSGLKKVSGVNWKLYGPNFDSNALIGNDPLATNIEYRGSFAPDDLPNHLAGSWGLVWDGDSIDTCSSATGNYLRYNNPHKLSLFLSCGMPVITWKEAAEAELVEKCKVGIVVDSLQDIPRAISDITADEMTALRKNVLSISTQLRNGEFARKAISAANEILRNIDN